MRRPRLITAGFLLGLAAIGISATFYPGGLGRFYGDTVLTNLQTGAVYLHTTSNAFFVGSISSNPVKVGIEGVATTNDINTALAVASLSVLSNSTLVVTNERYIATVGACTITLPTASAGRSVHVIKRDDDTLLTINGGTIENESGARITTRFSAEFLSDGSKWWIK